MNIVFIFCMNGFSVGAGVEGPLSLMPFQAGGNAQAAPGPGEKFEQTFSVAMAAAGSAPDEGMETAAADNSSTSRKPAVTPPVKPEPQKTDERHKTETKPAGGNAEASLKGKDKDKDKGKNKNDVPASLSLDANLHSLSRLKNKNKNKKHTDGAVPEAASRSPEKPQPSLNAADTDPADATGTAGAAADGDLKAKKVFSGSGKEAFNLDSGHAGGDSAPGGQQDGSGIQNFAPGQNKSDGEGRSAQFESKDKYSAQCEREYRLQSGLKSDQARSFRLPLDGHAGQTDQKTAAQAIGNSTGAARDHSAGVPGGNLNGQPALTGQSQGQTVAQSGLLPASHGGPALHGAGGRAGSGTAGGVRPGSALPDENEKPFVVTRQDMKSIEVRIEPEGLGKMDIRLVLDKGHLNAHINAFDSSGKQAVEGNLPSIIGKLAGEGINVGSFSVSLKNGRQEKGWREGAGKDGGVSRVEKTGSPPGPAPDVQRGATDHGEVRGAGLLSLFA